MDGELASAVVQSLRVRLLRAFPDQIRACLAVLDDEQIWWRPHPQANSVGNLVLHTAGSLMEFVAHRIGGVPFHRDRPQEFAAAPLPRQRLLEIFDESLRQAAATLDRFDPQRLLDPSVDPDRHRWLLEDLVSQTTHVAAHAAQIAWITKLQRGGGLDDLWMKAHRQSGAWKA